MIKIVIKDGTEILATKECNSERHALKLINSSEIRTWNKDPGLNKWEFKNKTVEFVDIDDMDSEKKEDLLNVEINLVKKQIADKKNFIKKSQDELDKLNIILEDLKKEEVMIE